MDSNVGTPVKLRYPLKRPCKLDENNNCVSNTILMTLMIPITRHRMFPDGQRQPLRGPDQALHMVSDMFLAPRDMPHAPCKMLANEARWYGRRWQKHVTMFVWYLLTL